jgi:ATP-dependent Clp protease ATP-binding subunit ClpC
MSHDSRYSQHARRALTHAHLLVQRYGHPYVDTSHLLVGVLLTEGSVGYHVLHRLNLNTAHIGHRLRCLYPILSGPAVSAAPTDALVLTLQMAADEALWLSQHYIGTEHLLLGLTRADTGYASDLLRHMGTSCERLRLQVRRALNEGATELDLQTARRVARLSELSRRVINAAEQMALSMGHPAVGLGHLILVLAQETRSPTSAWLRASGLDEARLIAGLRQQDARLLIGIERVLNQTLDLVARVGSHFTGTEHLVRTLVQDADGRQALVAYGVNLDHLTAT